MKKSRLLSTFVALSLVIAGCVAISPANRAEATTTWPMTIENSYVVDVIAHKDGGFSAMGCNASLVNATNATYVDAQGEVRNSLPSVSAEGVECSHYSQQGFEDGTLYGVRFSKPSQLLAELVSWKNNRELWATDISAPNNCVGSGSWTSKRMHPVSMSQGSNGLVYMVLTPEFASQSCQDRLVAINPATGVIIHDVALGTQYPIVVPRVWTYDDMLLVLDSNGVVREFSNDAIEDVSARYQFTIPSGRSIEQAEANDEGAVFVATPGGGSTPPKLFYRKADGTGGVIDNNAAWPAIGALSVTHNGSVVGIARNTNTLTWFNLGNNTVTAQVLTPETTGYAKSELQSYHEDEDGNAVIQWNHWSLDWQNTATSVDVYDKSTDSTDRVFLKEHKESDLTNYPAFISFGAGVTNNGIADGNLYLAICEDTAANCFSSAQAPDIAIQKIVLGSFGDPLSKGFKRNNYESQKLEYVAMGDSYSSGEGTGPFLIGTDDDENRCHRSKTAYPMLLEKNAELNLNLTAFASCAGAVTANINGPGQWESKQIDALEEGADIVTLSIGGNDVGMVEFATACTLGTCDEYTALYTETLTRINSLDTELENVYTSILSKLPSSGRLYVTDYPMIAPIDMTSTDLVISLNPICLAMYNGSVIGGPIENPLYNHWGNARAAQNIMATLNARIELAVHNVWLTDSRINFVDVSSSLEGHDICSTSPYFYVNTTPPGIFHPDDSAHEIFEHILSEEIG